MKSIYNVHTGSVMAALVLLMVQQAGSREAPFGGQVVGVTDGDTIKVLHDGVPEKIRLKGIDCPEKKQAFGSAAKSFTSALCFGKTVSVAPVAHDRYGRTIADIALPDGRILSQELVRAGYARWYQRYAPHDATLRRLEIDARTRRAGLWSETNPISPWDYRAQRRSGAGAGIGAHRGTEAYGINH